MTNMITEVKSKETVTPVKTSVKDAQLKKACADFESIFIYYMLKSMRKSFAQNGILDKSREQNVYKSMADQAMAENIAREKGIGLGQVLYEQLNRAVKRGKSI